jgi:hypothetical protein
MFVCCECCVLSGRGPCDRLITRPEESYRLWRVIVCDQETSKTKRLKPFTGLWKIQPQWVVTPGKQTTNNASSWFYYKEICYDVRSHERNTEVMSALCYKRSLNSTVKVQMIVCCANKTWWRSEPWTVPAANKVIKLNVCISQTERRTATFLAHFWSQYTAIWCQISSHTPGILHTLLQPGKHRHLHFFLRRQEK